MGTSNQVIARQRIENLLDDNSFVEIGAGVKARTTDFNIKTKDTPSDGVVTGYGLINDRLVYVYSQDPEVLGGSVGEMHAKKIVHLYNLALKMGAPVIGIVDSTGLRLQESVDGLGAFGKIYAKQSVASGVIPMITAVFGNCGGGLSIVAGLSDFVFMEADKASLFLNAPNTIDDNKSDETKSAAFQSEVTGNVSFKGNADEIYAGIRDLFSVLPGCNDEDADFLDCEDDLNRGIANATSMAEDTAILLASVSDNGFIMETKKDYAPEMVTAFIKLNGATVGAVANRTKIYDEDANEVASFENKLTSKGCEKAAKFVDFCDSFNIPVLTLTNVDGFATSMDEEVLGVKNYSKLVYAFSNASVPKVNLIVKDAMGSSSVVMNSKSTGADIVYAWPQAKIGIMEAGLAVKIIYASELESADNAADLIAEKTAEYNENQNSIEAAAARGYVDSVINPEDTRKYLIAAFEMLYTKLEDRPSKKHGTV